MRLAIRQKALWAMLAAGIGCVPVSAQMGGMGGGGFGGPAVMGRGGQAGTRGGQAVRLRGFGSVNGIYDSGLTTINDNGVIRAQGAGGVEALWGAYGMTSKRRSALGLDYQGDYRQYNGVQGWNGLSQTLNLTYSSQPFKRVSFDVSGMAGTTNRAFGAATSNFDFGVNGVGQLAIPTTSFFDVRTNFYGGTGALTVLHSSRLSSSYSASGFAVRRRNRLPGVDGLIGRADLVYRIGRRQTIGMDVMYYKFDYRNAFGDVNIIDPGVIFGQQIGRRWELGLRVGIMRVESFGTRVVNFAPEVAALLGVGQTSEIFYQRTFQPSGQARLLRTFKRGSIQAAYRIIPSPGNGLLFAARQNSADVVGTWNASRRLVLSVMGTSARLSSVTALAGTYEQYLFGGGVTYRMARSMDFLARVDRRVAQLNTGTGVGLNGTRFTVGVAFAPSDLPLQLW